MPSPGEPEALSPVLRLPGHHRLSGEQAETGQIGGSGTAGAGYRRSRLAERVGGRRMRREKVGEWDIEAA
ncbi:MAG: hypothetical protein LBR80_01885 [Deltaproteobacteria bacterium]|nr:hypothetical protein [Deltaproteobacteria bacterium]